MIQIFLLNYNNICLSYSYLLVAKSHFMVVIEVLVHCLLVVELSYLGSFSQSGNLEKDGFVNKICNTGVVCLKKFYKM